MPDIINAMPAIVNTKIFFSEKKVIHDADAIRPANAAPSPRLINNAGIAQQKSVPRLKKSPKKGGMIVFHEFVFLSLIVLIIYLQGAIK